MGYVRLLPVIVEVGLLVFCLIDCIQTDEGAARNLGKGWWVLLIILLPLAGSVAWLVAGRPTTPRPRRSVPWPATATAGFPEYERPRRVVAPDDDPEFLAGIRTSDDRHERMLAEWEAQLRQREERLRAAEGAEGADDRGSDGDRGPGTDAR